MPQETVLNHPEVYSPSGPPPSGTAPSGPPEMRDESELDLIEMITRTLLTLLAAVLGGFIGAVRVFFRHTMETSSAAET